MAEYTRASASKLTVGSIESCPPSMAVGDTSMQNWKVSDPPAFKVGASMASSRRTAEQSLSLYWRESVPWKMADRSHPGVPSSVPRYVAVNWMTTYWPAGGSLKSLAPATMEFPSSSTAEGHLVVADGGRDPERHGLRGWRAGFVQRRAVEARTRRRPRSRRRPPGCASR